MPASELQIVNEVVVLRRENRRLRYQAEDRADARVKARVARMIERTFADAQALLAWHFAWQETQRETAPLSHRRWTYAVALLKLARLADPRARYLRITASDPGRAAVKLGKARETALADPSSLRAMLPASRRPGKLR